MKAIVVNNFGGPESMEYSDVNDCVKMPNYKILKSNIIGINFADTHQTENTYLIKKRPPFIPGAEVVGIDEHGNRYLGIAENSYSEYVSVHDTMCFDIPDLISDRQALACGIQGVTAYMLTESIKPGQTVLVYGASSGVGLIAIQLAKLKGARVVAVTSESKMDLVKLLGADSVVSGGVPECNPDLILDMIGGKVFEHNLNILNQGGTLVLYGMASREAMSVIDPYYLMATNKTVKGFWLHPYFGNHVEYQKSLNVLYDLIISNKIRIISDHTYSLSNAKQAHEDILSRNTYGKVCLIP